MKRIYKRLLSIALVVSLLITSSISALAVDGEKYLCELRLVYAEDSDEARAILDDGEFFEYELYEENLNQGTDKIGVFLAYKTTEDIEDAITDIAVMQMYGGYEEGNYQEMIQKSEQEYLAMAQIYTQAIDHWKKAYSAGNFLAKAAYRQLNFYTVIDKGSSNNGKLLGDIFLGKVDQYELATMFFQGNSYALDNIRSLISMGVAFDYENNKYYLDKVKDEAKTFGANKNCYDEREENFENLAKIVAPSIKVFKDAFWELSDHADELNYEDDNYTALEVKYMEYAAIAELMKKVDYLDGKTLYQFCYDFEYIEDEEEEEKEMDFTSLYPLIGALNPGQLAMTKAFHYYDVVRYGLGVVPEKTMTEEIDKLEEKYKDDPFDIYKGVDRTIYDGTFALTSAAYRADAYTEGGLAEYLFGEKVVATSLQIASGGLGAILLGTALKLSKMSGTSGATVEGVARTTSDAVAAVTQDAASSLATKTIPGTWTTYEKFVDQIFHARAYKDLLGTYDYAMENWGTMSFTEKMDVIQSELTNDPMITFTAKEQRILDTVNANYSSAQSNAVTSSQDVAVQSTQQAVTTGGASWGSLGIGALYIIGGALMIYTAVGFIISINNYYNPNYDDVPATMVDLIDTEDGDRYIKYDAVFEAEAREGEKYIPGDTNAYTAHRWNALYYTKSYEAGKPLLAEFSFSGDNNTPDDGYAPIHCFGELISFDLNRYHINDSDPVYLSIEQSENQKAAVAEVPELVGSIFSTGWALLAGGIGALAGIGGTIGMQKILKKKKKMTEKSEA